MLKDERVFTAMMSVLAKQVYKAFADKKAAT